MNIDNQKQAQYRDTLIQGIKKNAGLAIFLGILLVVLGVIAVGAPFITGISVIFIVGTMLVASGILQLYLTFKSKGGALMYLMAVLNIFIGIYMLGNPGVALETITLFLAIYLIVVGISEAVVALQIRPAEGWGWALFSALMSVLLGVMIWNQFPVSGLWTIGVLVGMKVIFTGWTVVMLGIAGRTVAKEMG